MRHARSGKKLGRDSAHRKALYSNLAGALITHGRIETTEAKAKAVKPFAEKMITLGKRATSTRGGSRWPSSARTTSSTSCSRTSPRASPSGRWLHPGDQARAAPGRRREHGAPRARGLRSDRVGISGPGAGCPGGPSGSSREWAAEALALTCADDRRGGPCAHGAPLAVGRRRDPRWRGDRPRRGEVLRPLVEAPPRHGRGGDARRPTRRRRPCARAARPGEHRRRALEARADVEVEPGRSVVITGRDGLVLDVGLDE